LTATVTPPAAAVVAGAAVVGGLVVGGLADELLLELLFPHPAATRTIAADAAAITSGRLTYVAP
jgi:hypothetical protein